MPHIEIDPVCGAEVITALHINSIHNNEKYYFCSKDCKEEFDSSPEDYIARVDEE